MAVIFTLAACSSKSSEPKAVLNDLLDVNEAFINNLEKSTDASGVAAAIDQYTADMKSLIPRLKEMKAKYPDFDMKGDKMPEEFKEFEGRFTEIGSKMMKAYSKLMPHMADPKVVKAQENMVKIMQDMAK